MNSLKVQLMKLPIYKKPVNELTKDDLQDTL